MPGLLMNELESKSKQKVNKKMTGERSNYREQRSFRTRKAGAKTNSFCKEPFNSSGNLQD